jgi:hypothetical protein
MVAADLAAMHKSVVDRHGRNAGEHRLERLVRGLGSQQSGFSPARRVKSRRRDRLNRCGANVDRRNGLRGCLAGEMRFETRVNQRVPDVNCGDRINNCGNRINRWLCVRQHAHETIVRRVRRMNGGGRERRGVESLSFLQRQLAAAAFAEMAWSDGFNHTFATAHNTSRRAFASEPAA